MLRFSLLISFPVLLLIGGVSARASVVAPRWEINSICGDAKPGDSCTRRENSNRSTLLNRWAAVSDDDRAACLAEVDKDGKRSYQGMLDCISTRALKSLEDGQSNKP